MKRAFFIVFLIIPLSILAQSGETLTNKDVIKLTTLDLPAAAIISKIKSSKTHFDVGVDALVELKKQGVSGEVISEMITANSHEQKEQDFSDPTTMRKSGIYYYNKSDPKKLFVPIDPTVVSNSKSGGFGMAVAQSYSYGISKGKHVSSLSGGHSRRQIARTKPKFYFYLNPDGTTSPNEFALVKLIERKNGRELTVGTYNSYGNSSGIDEKQKIDFTYDQVADGIYKVYANDPLEEGEYCFIYTGSAPTIFSNNKVYDFGISATPSN